MRFGYTLLYVDEVEKSLEFYERAFGLTRKFFHSEEDQAYGELNTGETTLGFVSHPLVKANGVETTPSRLEALAPPFEIGLVTEHVDAAFQTAVDAGATPVTAPKEKPWGQRVSYVRDFNGFLIEICSEVKQS